ncbi:hypothetical protein [Deinococcus sp. UYEF24]
MPLKLFLVLAVLSGQAAGIPALLDRTAVLWTVPGVLRVQAVPDTQLMRSNYTHTLTVRFQGAPVRVDLTAGASNGSIEVNTVLMWVERPHANANGKAVLVRVARAYLQHCMTGVTPSQLHSVQALIGVDWRRDHGWQIRQIGQLKLEWGEGEGLTIAGRHRSGLALSWPAGAARCAF